MDLRQFSNTGSGFGQGAYNRAKAAGLSDAQIRAGLKGSGLTTGSWASNKLNSSSSSSSRSSSRDRVPQAPKVNLQQYSNTGTGFGQGAYERARAAGVSDASIRQSLPLSGLTTGSWAANQLGADTRLYDQRGGGGQMGMGTYNNLKNAGLSNAQIRQSLASSGLTIGPKAADALNVNPGFTYYGYAEGTQQGGYKGNSGKLYDARALLAPKGYGLDASKGWSPTAEVARGYSPTFYAAGGVDDQHAYNFLFNTDKFNATNVGGGYSDPNFHTDNEGFVGAGITTSRGASPTTQVTPPSPVPVNNTNPTSKTTPVGTKSDLKIGTKSKKGSGSSAFKRAGSGPERANTSLTI